jgi:hypothetical protein
MMTIDDLQRSVLELQDRQAISDCLMRYSRGIDRLDRELLLSAYHEDAIDDHGDFVGSRDEFADHVLQLHAKRHLCTQHCLFNHTCDLQGDVAHTETYYMFAGVNREGDMLQIAGGRYLDRLERRDGRWAIAQRICLREWSPFSERPDFEDPTTLVKVRASLPPEMLEFIGTSSRVRRDRSDPSYDRPLTIQAERIRRGRELRH